MAVKVGLSTTVIQKSLNSRGLDGIGVYTKKLQHFLTAEGCEVEEVFFPKPMLNFGHKKSVKIPYSVLSALAVATKGLNFRHSLVKSEVFHATDYRILPMRIPVVATLHDAIPLKSPEMANSRLRSLKNYILKSVAHFADQVVTVSEYSIAELEEYYKIPRERIEVVHNGVDEEWFENPDRVILENILKNRSLRRGYFLTVGTLQPRKNYDRLIDAYLSLPKYIRDERQLVLIGRNGWLSSELVSRLRLLSDQGVIWLDNVISESELRYLYSGAGVFVFPSLYEGFGIPLLEAMARKIPCLASKNTSLPEVGGNAACYFDPYSVDEMADGMINLSNDLDLRDSLALRGYDRAKLFTWHHTAKKMMKIYQSLT